MKLSISVFGLLPLFSVSAFAQTELIYAIDKPNVVSNGWGGALVPLSDLDGDGIGELAVRVFGHGQAIAGTVHSGATGALMFTLDTPFVPVFWGDDILDVPDETGDGINEIVVIGGRSGAGNSPNGRLRTYSGADGSLIRDVTVPAGIVLQGNMQSWSLSLGDIDGDGHGDILCRPVTAAGLTATLLSGATGEVIYSVVPEWPAIILADVAMLLDDFDGDGKDDFVIPVRLGVRTRFEIRSAASGTLISTIEPAEIITLTGNGEPFIGVADMDGDGLRDIGIGALFEGRVALYSSATGNLLQLWDCSRQVEDCMGRGLIEISDISGDGHPDLLALETQLGPDDGRRLFALDPLSGEVLFEQVILGLNGGYSTSVLFVEFPGVDGNGFPSFAVLRSPEIEVEVRRVLPEVGARHCDSLVNSSGSAATLNVYGSVGIATGTLSLVLEGAAFDAPGYFIYGSQEVQLPFGNGFLCVGGSVGRLAAVSLDGVGHATVPVDLGAIGEAYAYKTFQALFRDPISGGFASSDAVTILIEP